MLYFNLYGAMDELIASFGLGALACCVLLIAAPSESEKARIVWIALSTTACLVGLFVAMQGNPSDAAQIALASGAALGFGTIGLIGQWCCVFAQIPARAIPFTFALSFFFGTLLWFILQIVGSFKITCIALIIISLCGGLLLALTVPASHTTKQEQQSSADQPGSPKADSPFLEADPSESASYNPLSSQNPTSPSSSKSDCENAQTPADAPEEKANSTNSSNPVKVRAAITLLDGFFANPYPSISWAHAFEALGGILVGFFILGIMYWPDAVEVAQTRALLKPLGYALASIVVFLVSARGSVSSLASGGMDRLRRNVIIGASFLAVISVLLLPSTTAGIHEALRLVNNFALAVLILFGFITSFIHILRHDPSPTFACAIIVLCGGLGLSLGILAFLLLGTTAYAAGAAVTAIYLIALFLFSLFEKNPSARVPS